MFINLRVLEFHLRYGGKANMAVELRRIILSRDELSSALVSFRRANEGSIPAGAIKDCEVGRDATCLIKIEPSSDSGDAMRDVTIAPPTLTDVLIRFCLENNVALPRSGRKRAVGHAGQAALEIHVDDVEMAGSGQPVARKVQPDAPQARAAG